MLVKIMPMILDLKVGLVTMGLMAHLCQTGSIGMENGMDILGKALVMVKRMAKKVNVLFQCLVILQLLIDDGVASRGHRNNCLNNDYTLCGIASGSHK